MENKSSVRFKQSQIENIRLVFNVGNLISKVYELLTLV